MGDLSGKIAVVTGGSRGIGRAIAQRLASEGANIAFNYFSPADKELHREGAFEETVELLGSYDVEVAPYEADVSDANAVEEMVAAIDKRWGRIDILVNNAGIAAEADITLATEEMWDRILGVNLKGQFLTARAVVGVMLRQGSGKIVNLASELALIGEPGLTAYCASKAGVIGFTKALARELAGKGVLVNCVAPGPTDTDMLRPVERTDDMIASIPLGRLGSPHEIASAVFFLVSSDTTWTTGQVISPNGGTVI